MILLIDNYDSFSYNLYQLIGGINPDIRVIRNDEMTADEIMALKPSHIIVSPGPGRPCDAGVCEEVIKTAAGKIPILGVCLGHQAICETFGAEITYAKKLMHGKKSVTTLDTSSRCSAGFLKSASTLPLAGGFRGGFPECLKVTARTDDGEIMAVEHRDYPIFGVQFHPESILTTDGRKWLRTFWR
ncbi:MAG: anthranilate synthase component II [Oscillospiraceae bacterium]